MLHCKKELQNQNTPLVENETPKVLMEMIVAHKTTTSQSKICCYKPRMVYDIRI